MLYKEDWEKASERIEAWWNCEVVDRVCLQVTAPKGKCKSEISKFHSLEERWTLPHVAAALNEENIKSTFWGGEAYPYFYVTLGPGIIGAYLGNNLIFDEGTTWQEPCISSIEDLMNLRFDSNNNWYKVVNNILDTALERGKDKYIVTLADIGGPSDTLANLLGPEKLCYELIDNPTGVKNARDRMLELWFKIYNEMYEKLQKTQKGSCQWLTAWSPGRTYPLECDFSAMISPRMFEEFFLPEIQAQCRFLDHSIYHLDGKEALKHLELLLDIPKLHAIQWCPGATAGDNKSMLQWIPVIKRIQERHKAVHIEVKNSEVLELLKYVSPKGLMIKTNCDTQEDAENLIRLVQR
jgi:hypothetical protein